MGEMADLNDALVRSTVSVDDGCDWTAWIIWNMRSNCRISNGVHQLPPERPQVMAPKITPMKKTRKARRRSTKEVEHA